MATATATRGTAAAVALGLAAGLVAAWVRAAARLVAPPLPEQCFPTWALVATMSRPPHTGTSGGGQEHSELSRLRHRLRTIVCASSHFSSSSLSPSCCSSPVLRRHRY